MPRARLAVGAARARARRRRADPAARAPRRAVGRRSSRSGSARATGGPRRALCTSGTAAANFHPAVLEAAHGRVPLIVCTADRPPELRDTGAGQTVDQVKLYGGAVRWFVDAGVPDDRAGRGRGVAAARVARGRRRVRARPPGPVHLNLPFREPLVPTGEPLVDAPGRVRRPAVDRARRRPCARPSVEMLDALSHLVADTPRGLVVAGWGAAVDPRTAAALRRGGGLARARRPDLGPARAGHGVDLRPAAARRRRSPPRTAPTWWCASAARRRTRSRRSGSAPTSAQVLVDPDGAWLDPRHAASGTHRGRPRAAARDARRRHRRAGRRGVDGRVAARRRGRGALRDRRAARRLGRAVRGSGRARRVRRGAHRRRARGRVEHAGARRRELRRAARRRARAREPRRQRHRRVRVDRARHRGRARGPDGRAARRPVLPARRRTGCSAPAAAASTPRSSSSTTTAAGSSRSSPRRSSRSTSRRCSARPHGVDLAAVARVHGDRRRRGACRRRRRARGRALRATPAACGSCSCAPTAPTTSPATARCGPRSAPRSPIVEVSERPPRPSRMLAWRASGADEGAEHGLELGLGLRPLGGGVGAVDDAGARDQPGPARRRARRRGGRWPTRRRRVRRPSRPGRRSGRGRSPRARGSAPSDAVVGVPPTAGVGCSRRARSSAVGAGRPEPAAERGGEVRDVAEHRDLGDRRRRRGRGTAGRSASVMASTTKPVLTLVLHRLGERPERRRVAVGDRGAGHRPRLDRVAQAADEELGARADEAARGVHEAARAAG